MRLHALKDFKLGHVTSLFQGRKTHGWVVQRVQRSLFVLITFVFKGNVTRSNFSCNLQRNKRCVASCKKKFTCNTPFCNCNCCVASCKKSRTTFYFSQRCETSCLRVTSPLQLERFFIRHRCVASCKKNCLV